MHLQPFLQGGTTAALQTTWNIILASSFPSHQLILSSVATSPSASGRATLLKEPHPVSRIQLLVPHFSQFILGGIWMTQSKQFLIPVQLDQGHTQNWRDRHRLQLGIQQVSVSVLEAPRKAHSLEHMHNYICFNTRPPETLFFKHDFSLNMSKSNHGMTCAQQHLYKLAVQHLIFCMHEIVFPLQPRCGSHWSKKDRWKMSRATAYRCQFLLFSILPNNSLSLCWPAPQMESMKATVH